MTDRDFLHNLRTQLSGSDSLNLSREAAIKLITMAERRQPINLLDLKPGHLTDAPESLD